MVGLLDELDQLVGHDAAADLAPLFHAVADAAVESEAVRRHLGGLVAAAALRHIQRLHRHILRLPQGLGPAADADGDGQVHAGVEGADFIQHIIAALCVLLQMALFHHGDIPAAGHPAQKAGAPPDQILQHTVDALQQAGALAVQHIAEDIVVAIHQKDHVAGAAGLVLGLHPAQRGLFVEDQERDALALARHRGAVDAPHAISQVELLAVRRAAELQVQAGQQLLRPAGQTVFAAQQPLAERRVVPQHRLAGEHRRRLRQGFQTVLGLGVSNSRPLPSAQASCAAGNGKAPSRCPTAPTSTASTGQPAGRWTSSTRNSRPHRTASAPVSISSVHLGFRFIKSSAS